MLRTGYPLSRKQASAPVLAAVMFVATLLPACAAELTAQELRGRTIYRNGLSGTGEPITAFLSGQTEVKANMVPCAGCHGLDGRGRPEGGVTPTSVRWPDLVRPYEVTAPAGRRHSQYTERSLVTAIGLGLDPAGNKLHSVMPKYAISKPDADDLIAYLKVLAFDYDPGVTDTTVRIGSLLPSEKRFPGMASVVRSALVAAFEDVNRAGGLYGRHIVPVFRELPEEESGTSAAYSNFAEAENVFAMVSSFLAGAEEPALEAISGAKVPLVGGWTLVPRRNSLVFYLDGGLPAEAEALAVFGERRYGSRQSPAILATANPLSQAALESARGHWPAARELKIESAENAENVAAGLKAAGSRVVLALLPSAELRALLRAARKIDWQPAFLVPSAFTPAEVMPDLTQSVGPVFSASAFLPADVNAKGRAEYLRLAAAARLPSRGFATQFTALCEAWILLEGMKRAGPELTRERLVESLSAMVDFDAGYRQPLSFGPNRHVGIPQVHIVTVEKSGALAEVTQR